MESSSRYRTIQSEVLAKTTLITSLWMACMLATISFGEAGSVVEEDDLDWLPAFVKSNLLS